MSHCFVLQSSERLHQEWMEREKIAQEEFRLKREKEEAAQKRKEEEEVSNFWTSCLFNIYIYFK